MLKYRGELVLAGWANEGWKSWQYSSSMGQGRICPIAPIYEADEAQELWPDLGVHLAKTHLPSACRGTKFLLGWSEPGWQRFGAECPGPGEGLVDAGSCWCCRFIVFPLRAEQKNLLLFQREHLYLPCCLPALGSTKDSAPARQDNFCWFLRQPSPAHPFRHISGGRKKSNPHPNSSCFSRSE